MRTSIADIKCSVYESDRAMAMKARYQATEQSRQKTIPCNCFVYTAEVLIYRLGKELAIQGILPEHDVDAQALWYLGGSAKGQPCANMTLSDLANQVDIGALLRPQCQTSSAGV